MILSPRLSRQALRPRELATGLRWMRLLIWIWFVALPGVAGNSGAPYPIHMPEPVQKVDITKLGFTPAYFPSDREFSKGYTLAKLMAADEGSKLITLSGNVAVLYATRPADGIRGHRPDCLQAFFIDVATGALVRKQEWHVRTRWSSSDRFDSEARIFPLSGGKYFVMADGKIRVYTADGELFQTKMLSEGGWAAKSVSAGDIIFLRHQSRENSAIEYLWLDSRTLETQHRFEDTDSVRIRMPYSATSHSVTYALRDGLHEVMPDGSDRVICADPMCRYPADVDANWQVFGQPLRECVIFVSLEGLLVRSVPEGKPWSRLTGYPGTGPVTVNIALLEIALNGKRLTLLLNGKHKTFDGMPLEGRWRYFIYDLAAKGPVFIAPQFSVNGDVREALSPTGNKFLAFDGRWIRVYDVP